VLLEMPLCRFRQVRDVIVERRAEEHRADVALREMELRWLCTMAASTQGQFDALGDVRLLRDEETAAPVKRAPTMTVEDLHAQIRPGGVVVTDG